ncbi:MAG: pyridoxine 5'-phosphate synthase [Bacteroidetes bacterium]|nr:pyridoxine 5'-phosphate synthase [Bacteroidota bacterium]
MIKLGINVDHVATVRQARLGEYPIPLELALLAEDAGADSITVHLREDRRHIQLQDVLDMKKHLKTKLNLEMAIDQDIIDIACDIVPQDVCLVPEKRAELTTEGGLNVIANKEKLINIIKRLQDKGICVSLFIDPHKDQIEAAKEVGADVVELHTGRYAERASKNELAKIINAAGVVLNNDLILNAGHGLNYTNVQAIAQLEGLNELNIGHSIIAYSMYVGIRESVSAMKKLISC